MWIEFIVGVQEQCVGGVSNTGTQKFQNKKKKNFASCEAKLKLLNEKCILFCKLYDKVDLFA